MWVTPLTAFVTQVPATASYYTVPTYYAPVVEPVAPYAYGMPMGYGEPVPCGAPFPSYYGGPCGVPAAYGGLPRGEYTVDGCLAIVQ